MSDNYKRILFTLISLLALSLLYQSVNRYFDHDEFEHIHSAWYIANGFIPYVDFFQNHHPLLWFIIAPLFKLFGSSVELVIASRILLFIFAIGTVLVVYRISLALTGSDESSLIALLLVLSVAMFRQSIIEIRPDVPQVFFGLLSVCFFLNHLKGKTSSAMIYAGLCASVSFLFLQKAVFLLLAYAIVFAVLFIFKKIALRAMLLFTGSFALPLCFFLVCLMVFNSFDDYLLTNWLVHMHKTRSFFPFHYFSKSLNVNGAFWVLSVSSGIWLLCDRRTALPFRTASFLALFLLGSVFSAPHPYRQYFLPSITLLSIIGSYGFTTLARKMNLSWKFRIILLIIIIGFPVYKISGNLPETNVNQLEQIDFVLKNTAESDCVYDGDIRFNLIRPDIHYFWFSIKKSFRPYNTLTNNRYADFDVCSLIKSKRPKIISCFMIDMNECGLDQSYAATGYGLFLRKGPG
jgi:hypothetical protein